MNTRDALLLACGAVAGAIVALRLSSKLPSPFPSTPAPTSEPPVPGLPGDRASASSAEAVAGASAAPESAAPKELGASAAAEPAQEPKAGDGSDSDDSDDYDSEDDELRCKMLLIVRKDLKMGKGKIGAQCGHATLGAYERGQKAEPGRTWISSWRKFGQKKVCLVVSSEEELHRAAVLLSEAGVPVYIVVSRYRMLSSHAGVQVSTAVRVLFLVPQADAGHTQVAPGSETVLGAGPAPSDVIDRVTGRGGAMPLKLLS